ncbi:hypothetical protein [Brevibacillus dissolubilis]|uniref:hypothetical protein n=1 Tax=Brevibacillus dissolubilis TaxID=1844116 RepID=UPI0011170D26|nr:hypothetical protein [Brevibacillus dissolubilis]
MTEENKSVSAEVQESTGKVSLKEAMMRKLAEKKQAQTNANAQTNQRAGNQMMKSQQTKKQNNQRRRMGV